jgi:hypothetical protein
MTKELKVGGAIFNEEEMRGILKYLNIVMSNVSGYDSVNTSGFTKDIKKLTEMLECDD